MNHKERVHAALRHEKVDRPPVWMWFHPETLQRLSQFLQVSPQQVAFVLGDDVRQTWVGNNYAMEGIVHENEGDTHTDMWGIQWVKIGPFNQIAHFPLQNASEDEILGYQYPYDQIPRLLQNMLPLLDGIGEYFTGCDISPCLFEMIFRLRGMENAALDLVAAPDLAKAMLAQAASFSIFLAEAACRSFAVDWLWTGDDVGGQQSMVMSPRTWRALIKPHLAEIFAVGKKHRLWVAYHSCGAIRPILPDLVEIGLNVLNPIQCNCPGMEPLELKGEFGSALSFMGGVDTQQLLPFGRAVDVYRETKRLLEGMDALNGGYILAASHAVPPETPIENILALYAAVGIPREEIFERAAEAARSKM